MKNFEVIEHTADIGIKAFGKTLSEGFENAAMGMFGILSDSEVEEIGEYKINLSTNNVEQLLVDFLSQLLYIHEVQNIMFKRCIVKINENNCSLVASVFGEKFDKKKHEITEIKAVTYHMLEFKKNDIYTLTVIFDI